MSPHTRAGGSLLVLLGMMAMAWMGEAMAGASRCYAVKDQDARNYCLAQAKRDYGYCYHIKNSDGRNQCLAEIKWTRNRCYAIKNTDARNQCRARVG